MRVAELWRSFGMQFCLYRQQQHQRNTIKKITRTAKKRKLTFKTSSMKDRPYWEAKIRSTNQKKFPTIYKSRNVIITFAWARNQTISRTKLTHSTTYHPPAFRFILILSFNWWSSSCKFLQPPVTSFLLEPNILFSTLFSNTLNLKNVKENSNY